MKNLFTREICTLFLKRTWDLCWLIGYPYDHSFCLFKVIWGFCWSHCFIYRLNGCVFGTISRFTSFVLMDDFPFLGLSREETVSGSFSRKQRLTQRWSGQRALMHHRMSRPVPVNRPLPVLHRTCCCLECSLGPLFFIALPCLVREAVCSCSYARSSPAEPHPQRTSRYSCSSHRNIWGRRGRNGRGARRWSSCPPLHISLLIAKSLTLASRTHVAAPFILWKRLFP